MVSERRTGDRVLQFVLTHGVGNVNLGRILDLQEARTAFETLGRFPTLVEANFRRDVNGSSSMPTPLGEPEERSDPLASPTLAALLAFQGNVVAAEELYRQLGTTDRMSPPDPPQEDKLVTALLAFREGARRLRSTERWNE